jgi:hypothetical protein
MFHLQGSCIPLTTFSVQPNALFQSQYATFVSFTAFFHLTLLHKVGRMMMNIRGLILDDPEHTTHLQTLRFAHSANSGLEIEEWD